MPVAPVVLLADHLFFSRILSCLKRCSSLSVIVAQSQFPVKVSMSFGIDLVLGFAMVA